MGLKNIISENIINLRKLSSNSETFFLRSVFHIFLIFLCVSLQAQQKEFWLIDIQTDQKISVKDSVSAVKFLDSLTQNNFYLTKLKNVIKEENRTEIYFDKENIYLEMK